MGSQVYLPDFLQEVALLTDLDSDSDNDGSDANDKVVLMTIHAAKGLEFPTVFVVGLEENIFPSPMSTNSIRELEEERRLLYVAITRAEKHCILTCAQNRFRYGRMECDTPSRFIRDFDPRLLRVQSSTQFKTDPMPRTVPLRRLSSVVVASSQPSTAVDSGHHDSGLHDSKLHDSGHHDSGLHEGNIIEHQRFGVGRVIKIEGTGENQKATVEFRNTGTKQLLLKFARYKVIS
jgi:DNA helicase-2/ATP-dependent DNA helicase PcrA